MGVVPLAGRQSGLDAFGVTVKFRSRRRLRVLLGGGVLKIKDLGEGRWGCLVLGEKVVRGINHEAMVISHMEDRRRWN